MFAQTWTISGTVLQDGGPVEGIGVCIHLKSTGEWAGVCGGTDSSGNYTTEPLAAGNDYVAYAIGDDLGLIRQMWNGLDCPGHCDFSLGTPIDLTSSDATGIDFNLTPSEPGIISGYIYDQFDQPTPGGAVFLIDQNGDWHGHFWTDENGYWESWPLPTGTYYAVTQYHRGFIEDVWDDGAGSQCSNLTCNPQEWSAISLPSGAVLTDYIFRLDAINSGGTISGNVSDGSDPLPYVRVYLFNNQGGYVEETQTDPNGNYDFGPRVDDTYYLRTRQVFGSGLAGELYDNLPCIPDAACDDPGYITGNGTPVSTSGGDVSVDFVLADSAGLRVQGQVTDADTGKPLGNIGLSLHDESGNFIDNTETDANGNYMFIGLGNGNYRLFAGGVPQGYEAELYQDVPCGGGCDYNAEGTNIPISGADAVANMVLDYAGTRIFGTVTRSGTGEPVNSDFGYMGVNVFDESGAHVGGTGTDKAGNYMLHLPVVGGSATYYVSTDHDTGYHALINECFDDVLCPDPYDPIGGGANEILLADGTTVVADFVLDPAQVISGTVVASDGGLPIEGVQLDLWDSTGNYITSTGTRSDGSYKLIVPGPGDYYVFTPPWGVPAPYLPEVWDNVSCNLNDGCDPTAVGNLVNVAGSASTTGIDFALDSGFTISGTVLDDGSNPLDGAGVCIHLTTGEWTGVCGGTDPEGNYTTAGLPPADNYVAYVYAEQFGLQRQMWNNIDCVDFCDFSLGTPIDLTSGDATGIDFNLNPAAPAYISGFIRNRSDEGVGGYVQLVQTNGDFSWNYWVDGNGDFSDWQIPPGNYIVLTGGTWGYMEEVWDGGDGAECRNWLATCDYLNEGQVLTVPGGANLTDINFYVDEVYQANVISGTITDEGASPVAFVDLNLVNSVGQVIDWAQSNESGYYEFPPRVDDSYYVVANQRAIGGTAPEVWDDVQCIPSNDCYDPGFITGNGTPLDLSGNAPGIDFVLNPAGWVISGQVTDADNGIPLADVGVGLYDEFGNGIRGTDTGQDGRFYFSGLGDGNYLVWADGPPEGYAWEIWNDKPCQPGPCDAAATGDVVEVSGGDVSNIDFGLQYSGTRIMGTVTRFDSGDTVSSSYAWMGVHVYDDSGAQIGSTGTDRAGTYQLHLPPSDGSATYYLRTGNDQGYHSLIDECWDDVKCENLDDPLNNGSTPIVLADGTTAVADFVLDPAQVIAGTVTASDGGAPIPGIQLDLWDEFANYITSASTQPDGSYKLVVPGPGNYYVFTPPWGVLATYMPEVWDNVPCNISAGCDPVANGTVIAVGGGNVGGIDFALDVTASISGTVTSSVDASPVRPQARLHALDGSQVTATVGNPDGSYTLSGMEPGTYYLLLNNSNGPLIDELYDNVHCPRLACDFATLGTQITINAGEQLSGYDAALDPGSQISGTVTVDGAPPEAQTNVFIYDASGTYAGFAFTDETGFYQSRSGLPAGSYYVVFGDPESETGYTATAWPNAPCGEPCDATLGDPVVVDGTNPVGGIDFNLNAVSSSISGNVTGSDTALALEGVSLWLFDLSCNFLAGGTTDVNGDYQVQTPGAGDYYLFAVANDTLFLNLQTPYMNQQYPGINVFDTCYPELNDVTLGDVISTGEGEQLGGYDFVLEPGGEISGTISDINGVLPEAQGAIRLYRTTGEQQYVGLNKEPGGSYRFGGILPGDYKVVLSSNGLGLIDERYDDIACPRNSCDAGLGQTFTFTGTESFTNVDAVLDEGAVIRGTLTDAETLETVPNICVYFYTDAGAYAAVACSDEFGNYETRAGLPDGLYRMSNQLENTFGNFEPVDGNYVPQVWTNDGSFVYCGEACDFLLGDTILVSGTTAVENIDLEMSSGFTISGVLTDAVTTDPVEGLFVCIGRLSTQTVVSGSCRVSDASGIWQSPALSPAADYIPFVLGRDTPYRSEKFDGSDCPFNWCDLTTGSTIDLTAGDVMDVDFQLDANTVISGQIFDDNDGSPVPLASGRVRLYYPDGSEVPNAVVNTNGSGRWFVGSLLPGSYWLLSTTRNGDLVDEVWDDVVCPRLSCDPGSTSASLITVADGDVFGGYDATLESGSQFFGALTENGNPYASGEVFIWNAGGTYAGFGFADGDGNWNSFSGLPAGDYTVTTQRPGQIDANEAYLPMAWPNTPCGDPCDVLAGETINVDGSSDVFGINLDLLDPPQPGENLIWGSISGDGIGSFGPDAYFEVFDGNYNYLGGDGADQYGHYFAFLPDGDYWFNFYGSGPYSHYVSEVQDGTQCPWNRCDFGAIAPLSPSGESTTRVDANLAEGVIFSGSVVQAGTATGIENVSMEFADGAGNVVFAMGTDPDGLYSTPGLPTMNYYVVADGQAAGFLTELYDDVVCPGGNCVSVAGDPGVVQFTPAPGDVNVANFDLDMGLAISGTVTDNSAVPLQGIRVDILDGSGDQVGFGDTDASGNYIAVLPGNGSYYALIAEWSSGDFVPEVWDDTPCNGCDPVANGTAIPVSGVSVGNINFALQPGNTLSGFVTAQDGGAGVAGVQVCSAQLAEFRWIACRDTDGAGYYEFTGLLRNDIVVWTQDLRGQLFVPEVWDDIPGTAWWTGTPIDLTSGNASADFALAASGTISGTVIESVTDGPLEGALVQLIDLQGGVVADASTDSGGNYTVSGFPAGDYYLMALKTWEGWIREVYPGQNVHFSPGDQGETPALLSVAGGDNLSGIDFDLDLGGVIWGTLRNSDAQILRGNARQVRLYDAEGRTLNVSWNGDQADRYNLGGIIPGTYWVLGSSRLQGLVDELFDDVPCPRLSCGTEPGVPIVIAPGDVVENVDFTLGAGSTVSGRVTDAETGDGLASYQLAVYESTGQYAGVAVTDADGYYTSYTAFPAGDYFVSNQFPPQFGGAPQGGYLPMVHNNLACGDPCNVLLGDPVTLNGISPVSGIDLALETGTELSGRVTTGGGATPLQGVTVQLLAGDDGSVLRTTVTDSNGDWLMSGIGSGDYFLRSSNALGYEDELHDGFSCNPFCDPLSGTLIQPNGFSNNVPPVDFDLELTPTISGTVTNQGAAPQANVLVGAYDTLGSLVATAVTDGSGNYSIGNLYDGSFFVKTANLTGYIDELYMDFECLPGCNAKLGTPVPTSSGAPATGIDLTLKSSSKISGVVRNSGATPISGIKVEIYRASGTFVGSDVTDGAGSYEIGGLSAGSYHAVTRNSFGYIDEGAGGVICQSTCSPVTTAPVAIGTNETVVVDYALDYGGAISGVVQDTALNPLGSVTVRAFNAAGVQIGTATTGPGGTYRIGGLAGGNVYLRTSNTSGFRNKRWNDLDCDALCDVLTGTPVAVSVNVEEMGIDFQLALGGSISGVVSGSGGPIAGVLINAYDTSSNLFAGSAVTAADGSYFIGGLEDDGYRLRTVNSVGYVDKWLGGDSCSPEFCLWNSGSIVTVASSDESGVDFFLARGDAISGVATDTMGVPLPGGTATVYSTTGKVLKSGAITGGSFYINGLANGTYFMVVFNGSGLVDELWSDIPCPGGSCNVTTGTPIVLGGAEALNANSRLAATEAITPAAAPRLVFEMDQGTILSGTMKNASNAPLQFKTVYILDSNGVLAGTAKTDGLGHFETESGFPDGNYYATTALLGQGGVGGGYIDEWFGGQLCTGECVGANKLGTPIAVPGGPVDAIDFVLDTGKSISGTVTRAAGGAALPSTTVVLYDSGGAEAGTAASNGAGAYSFMGLVPGDYYLKAIHPSGDYSDLLYDSTLCDGCDVTTGDAVTVNTADISGVDFALSLVPDIDIEKFTNGVNADRPTGDDVPVIAGGATVTWTYRVTNSGGEALEDIVVTDSVEGSVTCPQTTLAAGASMDCILAGTALALSAQGMVVTGSCQGETNRKLYRNTATVAAIGVTTATAVGDSDPSHYCNPKPQGEVIFSSGFE